MTLGWLKGDAHREHVIPLSRGGWHDPSNVVPACPTCNLKKGAKTAAEWKPEWVPPPWVVIRPVTIEATSAEAPARPEEVNPQ